MYKVAQWENEHFVVLCSLLNKFDPSLMSLVFK